MEINSINSRKPEHFEPKAHLPSAPNRVLHNVISWFGRPILFPQCNPISRRMMGLDLERLNRANNTLVAIGGEPVVLKTAHGEKLEGMVFKASKFWGLLMERFELVEAPPSGRVLVSRKGRYNQVTDGEHVNRMVSDSDDMEFASLLEKFGFVVITNGNIPGVEGVKGLVIHLPMRDGPMTQADAEQSSHPTALVMGGNRGFYNFYREEIALYLQQGMDVVVFNYRGSGESGGTANGQRLFKDAETVYQHVRQEMGVEDKDLLIYGHCMGGAAAANLAASHPDAHLILDRTWSRLEKVVSNRFGWLEGAAQALLPSALDFNNGSKVSGRAGSTLFISAEVDEVIGSGHVEEMKKDQDIAIQTRQGHSGTWALETPTTNLVAMFLDNNGLGRRFV